ncbi:MAG: HEAT repeat domain-containing protein [Pseudanabaenaceae cyanobacterium]|jgi:phycocyanobilin lyase alpha subunit
MQGEQLTVEQAITNLHSEDTGLRFYAAWWLGRFRINTPEAVDGLIAALEDEDDRTEAGGYPLRRNASRALGKLGDRRAVPPLIECLHCSDYYVREAAAQSLEMLGDLSCVPTLLERLQIPEASSLPSGQPLTEPYDAILEALGTLGAKDAIPAVAKFVNHPVGRVQCSAWRAMYQLTGDTSYGDKLINALSHKDLQLRRTVLGDLGAIGYLAAAQPIAKTLAENSLKLISLKGLLEKQVHNHDGDSYLSAGAREVMAVMDDLL